MIGVSGIALGSAELLSLATVTSAPPDDATSEEKVEFLLKQQAERVRSDGATMARLAEADRGLRRAIERETEARRAGDAENEQRISKGDGDRARDWIIQAIVALVGIMLTLADLSGLSPGLG